MIPQYQGFQSEKVKPLVQSKLEQMDETQIYRGIEKDFIRMPKQNTQNSEYSNNYNYQKTIILKDCMNNLEKKYKNIIQIEKKEKPKQQIQSIKFEPLIQGNPFHEIVNLNKIVDEDKENKKNNTDNLQQNQFRTSYESTFLRSAQMIFQDPLKYQSKQIEQIQTNYIPTDKINRKNYKNGFKNYGKDFHNTILFTVNELIDDPNAELLRGTTKISQYIPGYQGYIPENNNNEKVRKILTGKIEREKYAKQSILDNYSKHIPGYAGYQPKCFK